MRRLLVLSAATVAATAALAGHASAHTPNISDSCTGLTVSLTSYQGPASNNQITVVIDGVSQSFDFGASFNRTFPWTPTQSHTWTVVVDANQDVQRDRTTYDFTQNGSEAACQATSTTAASTTSTSTTVTSTTSTSTTQTPPTSNTPTSTAVSSSSTSGPSSSLPPASTALTSVPASGDVATSTEAPAPSSSSIVACPDGAGRDDRGDCVQVATPETPVSSGPPEVPILPETGGKAGKWLIGPSILLLAVGVNMAAARRRTVKP